MSVKAPALRAQVMERLVAAADEIFALFERTFAEYQDEVLRSKLLQQPHVNKEDIQTVTVGADTCPELTRIKQEEGSPLRIPLPSVKTEENINKSTLQKDPAEENSGEQCEGEEPGCSLDLHLDNNEQHNSCSDTDNSSDWEFMDKSSNEYDGQELEAGHSKNSATNDVLSDDQPYKCGQCFKSFKTQRNLKKHLQHHAGQGSYTCKICNKVYGHKYTYKEHLQIHSEQNPFRCPICERVFFKSGHLNEHMSIHTGEKPYSCAVCGMKFRLRKTRVRHFHNVHTAQKPYTCLVCQKGFIEKYTYVAHMRKHTGERPFRCSLCDKSYLSKDTLRNHVRKVHKADAEIKVTQGE